MLEGVEGGVLGDGEKKKENRNVTGRSADDLRERLNFIKKYI